MSGTHESQGKEEGWIEWSGGECPVDGAALVNVKFRDGGQSNACPAHYFRVLWRHAGMHHTNDIIAYRIHKESSN
jgi:hypothetical protein